MDFLKQWTFCVCTALCSAVIFSLFTPKGKMKSFYKILISLFVFISFLYPFRDFKGFSPDYDISIPSGIIEEESSASYEQMLNNQIKEVLKNSGITGADVSSKVKVDYSSDELIVEEVQVAVSDEYNLTEVESLIYDALGIKARVIYVGQ